MMSVKIVLLLCLSSSFRVLAEEPLKDVQLNDVSEDGQKLLLEKSEPYNRRISTEASSIFSKLKSWIFPFGGGDASSGKPIDSIPVAGRHFPPIYSAPSGSGQQQKANCNPCNKEPWIPVVTNYGQNSLFGFVQPSQIGQHYSTIGSVQPPPSGQYGVPNINTNYGAPPNQINTNFALPPQNELNTNYGIPQSNLQQIFQNLGPPPPPEIYPTPPVNIGAQLPQVQVQNLIAPIENYGSPVEVIPSKEIEFNNPINLNYGPPSSLPNSNYGPPPSLPPNSNYGPPPSLPPNSNYGPPPSLPNSNYGPPSSPANSNYGPPSSPPNSNYGPPPSPPNSNYGPPPSLPNSNYGPPPPSVPNSNYPPPNTNHIQQRPGKSYGPPQRRPNSHGPLNYPPVPKDFMGPPPLGRGRPKHLSAPPRFVQKPNSKPRPPSKDYGAPFYVPEMKPPQIDTFVTNYGVLNQFSTAPTVQYGPPNNININLPPVLPSDSYGAPIVGGDVKYAQGTRAEYLPPINGGVHVSQSVPEVLQVPQEPIPFPNLNQFPLTPIHSAKDFHQNNYNTDVGGEFQESRHREVYNSNQILSENQNKEVANVDFHSSHQIYSVQNGGASGQKDINPNLHPVYTGEQTYTGTHHHLHGAISPAKQKEIASDIQIVQSIPVANFLSSIEHPINLIQSPVVDVTATAHNQNGGEQKNEAPPQIQLSNTPIVVEPISSDNHPSASIQNLTYESSFKRDNDLDLAIPEFSNEVTERIPHPFDVNQLVQNAANIRNEINATQINDVDHPKFTPPPLDYTSWSPSTNVVTASMVPPPPGESLWFTPTGQAAEIVTTTKKPKQIQIVIPYTNTGKVAKLEASKGKKTTVYDYVGPKLSLYTQPPTSESVWLKYADKYYTEESTKLSPVPYTDNPNLKDLLLKEEAKDNPPFDVISLQKNIDKWTHQEYSKHLNNPPNDYSHISTPLFPISSKNIPTSFLSTNFDNVTPSMETLKTTKEFYDHEPAGSNNKESKINEIDFETNFIVTETSTIPTTTSEDYTTTEYSTEKDDGKAETTLASPVWGKPLSFSDSNKEKIYVITPQPLTRVTAAPPMISFSHPPRIGGKSANEVKDDFNEGLRLILSEWPHIINNLETTTTQRPTSPHPLFGLMDLSPYIPPPNSTIQTYAGHSKVITIVTPISLISRKVEDTTLTPTEPTRKT